MGCTDSNRGQLPASQRTCSAISCGPVAQFSPISGTSSAWTTAAAAAMSGPTSSVPVVSTVTCTKIGMSLPASARAILAPFTAALICNGSWQVSIRMRVDAAGDQAAACRASAASSGS